MPENNSPVRLVLLVEDSPEDARYVCEMLAATSRCVYQVHHVPCLAAAVEWLGTSTPDAVLLDLGLPETSGIGTLLTLRDRTGDVPIVVLTGTDDETLATTCLEEGAQDYLWKGEFRSASLHRAIENAISRARAASEQRRLQRQLEQTLAKMLSGCIFICAYCKRIREGGRWHRVEEYFGRHSEAVFSHGICPECSATFFPDLRPSAGKSAPPSSDPPKG